MRCGMDRQTRTGIANSVGVNAHAGAVGIEFQNVSPMVFTRCCVGIVHVRCRTYRDKHFLPIRAELHIAGPVPSAMWQVHKMLRCSRSLQVAVLIRKSYDGVCVSDVDPLRILAGRIKSDAVRTSKAGGKNSGIFWFAIRGDSTEDLDFAAAAFCQEKVPVGSGANQSRVFQSCRVKLNGEARGCFRPSVEGAGNQLRPIVGSICFIRNTESFRGDFPNRTRLLKAEVRIWCWWRRSRRLRWGKFCRRRAGLVGTCGILER